MPDDPTRDPLTQDAWDRLMEYIDVGIQREYNDYGRPNEQLMDRIRQHVELIERLRYNYMAMTMLDSERIR